MNLIPCTPQSLYKGDLPVKLNGVNWINVKNIVDMQTVSYVNSAGTTVTTGCMINYAHNHQGWRTKYSQIIVSETLATMVARCSSLVSTGARASIAVVYYGGNTVASTMSIPQDDILLMLQSTADALITSPGQCTMYVARGVWGTVKMIVSLTPQGVVNALVPTGGVVEVVTTIGYPGSTTDPYAFTSAANKTAQNIKIATVPQYALVSSLYISTPVAFAGGSVSALNCTLGNASADNGILTSTDMHALTAPTVGTLSTELTTTQTNAAAVAIWLGATPVTANWSALTAGQLKVIITYNDLGNA
jgi:hypothetical protein